MSLMDSMYDQFYEHLLTCELCKAMPNSDSSPDCEKGTRMEDALRTLANGDF